uniref:Nuclear pore complex protein Nup50 n=2 Tax=Amphiprion ocellaris TaxID=80972 RepID=A0A3Q1C766_AMPOC
MGCTGEATGERTGEAIGERAGKALLIGCCVFQSSRMAKRIADKELTDRNWDQEEEGEEAGTFSVASEDVLKNRAIKKAKRRNTGAESEAGGAFKSFKGFSLASAGGVSAPTAFSGFGNGGGLKGLGGLTNGNSASFGGFSSTAGPGVTFNGPSSMTPPCDIGTKQTNGSAPGPAHREYSRQLTALNCSVRDWITKHVNDNPLCDLQPIFRDYERHLSSIERQYGSGGSEGGSGGRSGGPEEKNAPAPSSGSSAALFSFSKTTAEDSIRDQSSGSSPVPTSVTFNFGQKVDSSVLSSLGNKSGPSFSFSSGSSQMPLFSSGASFSGSKPDDDQTTEENPDEESEEPPKPEVKEVKEDNAFYSKKCKMFYKKDSEFKEKGVGTLHLKQTDGKTQMIIRADTNLGNILLNIMVHSSMPCSRVGKNNVMVVCVPNPPVDDKNPSSPVPLLIRVKTSEDADELHKTLEEKK